MKKRILSVLLCGSLLFGTIGVNAVSIGFEDLKQNSGESSIYLEDLEQSDKTSDLEETQIPKAENIETISENSILESNEADSYIDEYYFPEATEENIQPLSLDSYNIMPLSIDNQYVTFKDAEKITAVGKTTTSTGLFKFSNTEANSSNYVIYSNAAVFKDGRKYDLVLYPFKDETAAYVVNSKTPKVKCGVDNACAGYKIIITEHDNINKPVSASAIIGFGDLDIGEFVIFPSNSEQIYTGSEINETTVTKGKKFTGKKDTGSSTPTDFNTVIRAIKIPTSGIIIYYGSTRDNLAAKLTFDEIENLIEAEGYQIEFNANGGSNNIPKPVIKFGSSVSTVMGDIGSAVPIRSGYVFKGWSADGGTHKIAYSGVSGATTTSSSWSYADYCSYTGGNSSNRTLTLYAQWEAVPQYSHTLSYNANGGTNPPASSTVTNTSSTYSMTVSSSKPTRTGYTFAGWNTNSSGTGTNYSAGNSISVGANATVTLYAKWTINTSILKVNPNGGTWNNSTATQSFTQNYNTTKSIPVPTRTGYTFTKWNRSGTNGSMTSLTGSSTYTFGASNGVTDTLTAEWKVNNYTVTYIDVIDSKSGKELGRSTASKPYNSTVRGADKGSSTTDNAYYNGYYYVSDTSATVNTSGATVYRIFKQRMNTIAGNIIWEDWNNKNLSRPENVNLYIKGSDGKTYSYVITGNNSQNTSVNSWPYSYNLPKYDSNGKAIVYTVSQDKAISQEKGLSYQEPLINGYDITNKITNMIINTEDYFQIPVTITWDDENDFYGFRPENATIQLLRNGEVIKTADVSDSYTFTELLKYDENGDKYVYTIQASDEKRYTKIENNSAPYNKTVIYTFVESSFSVLIPKVIVLDGNQGNADYDITVNGAFYYNDTLTVKPANSFTMTDRSNISQMKANILQSKQNFMKEDIASLGAKAAGSIQVDRTNFAGLWTGTFNFDIKFVMQN